MREREMRERERDCKIERKRRFERIMKQCNIFNGLTLTKHLDQVNQEKWQPLKAKWKWTKAQIGR